MCNEQRPCHHEGARLEGREGSRGFASAVQHWPMWILLRMARTGLAARWPGAQFFPMPRKMGIPKGSGVKTTNEGQQGVRCGGEALEGSVTGGGCTGETMQRKEG